MKSSRSNGALAAAVGLATAFLVQAGVLSGDEPKACVSSLESELRATETAFATTMGDRDHAAFVTYLADETIFFGPTGALRGRSAVAAAWRPFFEGETAPFSWKPDAVAVLETGDLGLTSGPVHGPDGARIGTFNSVWRRQKDGSWRIVFDRGCPPCR